MLLAVAVLLLHPQLGAPVTLAARNPAEDAPAVSIAAAGPSASAHESLAADDSSSPVAVAAPEPAAQPASDASTENSAETSTEIPNKPSAVLVALASPAPGAFLKSAKPMTVSVEQLQAENRRKEMMWTGLTVAASSAAMFDAISTRHAITTYGAVELNPLLKPFAGNSSLFAAIQVAPALLDYAGRKMMYSRHGWLRRAWFVPQSASFVTSILCGAHNFSYR